MAISKQYSQSSVPPCVMTDKRSIRKPNNIYLIYSSDAGCLDHIAQKTVDCLYLNIAYFKLPGKLAGDLIAP